MRGARGEGALTPGKGSLTPGTRERRLRDKGAPTPGQGSADSGTEGAVQGKLHARTRSNNSACSIACSVKPVLTNKLQFACTRTHAFFRFRSLLYFRL